jgi:hypothetical protein
VRGVPKSAGFAFETATVSLREQIQRVDALDTKAGILLAANGITASLVFSRTSLPSDTPPAVILVSGFAVLISLTSTLISFVNRNYALAPTPKWSQNWLMLRRTGSDGG